MRSRRGTAIMTVAAVAAFASGIVAEEKLQKLSAGQIRAKIAGMELTDEVHWRELYGRGGTVTSDSMGRKRTGKWRVEKDQLCVEFDKEPPACCRCKGSSNRPRAANSQERSLPVDARRGFYPTMSTRVTARSAIPRA
jgi:hypothetical protein